MSLLETIKTKYDDYLKDPSYVYKYCNGTCEIVNELKSKGVIIIMQKVNGDNPTITNESRTNVFYPNYAKFRASHLKVILIFDIDDPDVIYSGVVSSYYKHIFSTKIESEYIVGQIIYPDKFDNNLNVVCSSGIHYFKTIDSAFYYRYRSTSYTGKWISYNDNGAKESEIEYLNGEKNGVCNTWFENGHKEIEEIYVNNKKNGKCIEYFKNEHKKGEIEYVDGEMNGKHIKYFSEGHKRVEGEYIDNKQNGKWIEWYENKYKKSEYEYQDDIKNGSCKLYYENGTIMTDGNYFNGKKNGKWIYFHNDGNKSLECECVNGKKCGKYIEWDKNGRITVERVYKQH
jgi:antitoxin component YwqK of YwqJK toxin-antitoxin module